MTPALIALTQANIVFRTMEYGYDSQARHKGLQAAAALSLPQEAVFKTLMTWVDSQPYCAVIPSHLQLNMQSLAAAVNGQRARLMDSGDAEHLTGYQIGGISPFGQRPQAPLLLDRSASMIATIWVNAGRRGLLVGLAPHDLVRAFGARLDLISQAKMNLV